MVHVTQALKALATVVLFSELAIAHPGHDVAEEIAERNAYFKNSKRNLASCSGSLKKRGMEAKQRLRRQALIEKARAERGLPQKRSIAKRDAIDESHLSTLDVTPETAGVEETIFADSSCILQPEVTIGPYYVEGEYVRDDIRETQAGVEIIVDAQFLDVNTCEPVPELMWDLWHCNSTGVYSGIVSGGNGDSTDESNLDTTFLRGLTVTDENGVATITSLFPGHYNGRATHIHVVAHMDGTTLSNGTYSGGNVAHIGQLFFDQSLITEAEALAPYTSNTQTLTTNAEDNILASELENDADPFLNYVLLGDTVADGLFMWISIGVDSSAEQSYTAAATLTADGGVANENAMSGGPGGAGGPPNGTFPGGNGTAPGGAVGGSTTGTAVSSSTTAVFTGAASRKRSIFGLFM